MAGYTQNGAGGKGSGAAGEGGGCRKTGGQGRGLGGGRGQGGERCGRNNPIPSGSASGIRPQGNNPEDLATLKQQYQAAQEVLRSLGEKIAALEAQR